jgi:hypothetical protein
MPSIAYGVARELHRRWTDEYKSLDADLMTVVDVIPAFPETLPKLREHDDWKLLRLWSVTVLFDPLWKFEAKAFPVANDLRQRARTMLLKSIIGESPENFWIKTELERKDFGEQSPQAKLMIMLCWSEAPYGSWKTRFGDNDESCCEMGRIMVDCLPALTDNAKGRLDTLGLTAMRLINMLLSVRPANAADQSNDR